MTKRSIFECDGCGDRYGAKNDVVPALVRHASEEWQQHHDETLHLDFDCGAGPLVTVNNSTYRRFLVDDDKTVVGMLTGLRAVHGWEKVLEEADEPEAFEAAKEAVEAAL